MKGYPAYLELLAIRNVFSPKQLEKISYFNVIGYVTGLKWQSSRTIFSRSAGIATTIIWTTLRIV